MKKVLKEIIEQTHDIDTCKHNWKKNGKIFNQIPKTCDFFAGSSFYNGLLKHEKLKLKSFGMVASDSNDEIGSSIGKFRYMLAILEDIKDDLLIGCRIQNDLNEVESKLQTL